VALPSSVFSITLFISKNLLPITCYLLPIISSCNDVPCAFQYIQKQNVTYQFADKHGGGGKPYITSHKSQCDGDHLSDGRQESEECHQCSFPLQEFHHLVYFLLLYFEVFLNPAYFAQTPHIVAGHSACRIAEGGSQYTGSGWQSEFYQCYQHQFGTEWYNTPCE